MATLRERPYVNGNFLVDLGTGEPEEPRAGFTEVVLPEGLVQVISYRAGNDRDNAPKKLPGGVTYGNVVLKRGVNGALDLYEWWDRARNGAPDAARHVRIQLLSEDRSETVMTWRLTNAWPARYGFTPLDAGADAVVLEVLELTYERFDVE